VINWFLSVSIPIPDSCIVLVVVRMTTELSELSVDDVVQSEDRIVSQWGEVSADEQHQMREQVDEILRPFGVQTRLLVVEKANSLALCFTCLTLSALMSLHDQWSAGQLRKIVKSLFRLLSGEHYLHLKRLSWPVTDYERCMDFFSSQQSK